MMRLGRVPLVLVFAAACAGTAAAGPLDGKAYIIELSSSQDASGYGAYLLSLLNEG